MAFIDDQPQYLDTSREYQLALADRDGGSLASLFTGSEAFAARIWPGASYATTATIAAAWDASVAGNPASLDSPVILVTVSKASLAGVKPGTYSLEVRINPGTDDVEAWTGRIKLVSGSGSDALPQTFADESDVLLYAAWIEGLQADADVAGFVTQLARATEKLKDAIVDRWKVSSARPALGQPGYAAWAMGGAAGDAIPSKWLRDQLDAGALIKRPKVKEIVARWAIAMIVEDEVARTGETEFQALGRWNLRQANSLAKTLRAEIDANGDGYAEIFVDLGSTNVR